ncbi:unnamed protein product [Ambrosiozyma monospora]|uniref:Unnamed protein product n=1 Tax=Ambrosiozyma monospora TaxID=43982 RepID=A0ACB5TCK4_AMBMO|nr:unnamed protein product [Ambrosiozyma monospora]
MLVLTKMSSFVYTLCLVLTLINQVQSAPVTGFSNIISEILITDSLSSTSYLTHHNSSSTVSSSVSSSSSTESSTSSFSSEICSSSVSSSELSSSIDWTSSIISSSLDLFSSSQSDSLIDSSSVLSLSSTFSSHLITSSSSFPITAPTSFSPSSVRKNPSSTRSLSNTSISDGLYPTVYAYQNGYEGFFEIDVPATLAPFVVDISAENFYFDYNTRYAQIDSGNASVQLNTENGISSSLYKTASYTYKNSGTGNDVRVGLGIFQDQLKDGNAMQAQFLVYPHTDAKFGSYDVPATLIYTATPVTASLTGEIPLYDSGNTVSSISSSAQTKSLSSSQDIEIVTVVINTTTTYCPSSDTLSGSTITTVFPATQVITNSPSSSSYPSSAAITSSQVTPSPSASLVHSTGNPVITVGVKYDGVLDVVHLSAKPILLLVMVSSMLLPF